MHDHTVDAPLTTHMLALLVRMRQRGDHALVGKEIPILTGRALCDRGLARWDTDSRPQRLVLTALGMRHVDQALTVRLPRHLETYCGPV